MAELVISTVAIFQSRQPAAAVIVMTARTLDAVGDADQLAQQVVLPARLTAERVMVYGQLPLRIPGKPLFAAVGMQQGLQLASRINGSDRSPPRRQGLPAPSHGW